VNVSSVDQNSWWYYLQATAAKTADINSGSSGQTASGLTNVQGVNAEGDTFQLVGNVRRDAGQYGPPPPRPIASSDSSNTSSSSTSTNAVSEIFSQLDTDSDGAVSAAELQAAMQGKT